jgi:hypothetical protein
MGTKWAEIELKQYHVLAEKAVLFVSTIGTGSAGQFWAIDSLRQCQDNGKSCGEITLKLNTLATEVLLDRWFAFWEKYAPLDIITNVITAIDLQNFE